MSGQCCGPMKSAPPAPCTAATTVLRRCGGFAAWAVPSAGLALMPKCPVCLAGYIALATGIGIPVAAAAWVRWGLIVLCAGSLVYLAARRVLKLDHRDAKTQRRAQ